MSATPPLLRTAWFTVILLMPVALLNYLDRQMLASMKTSVISSIPSIETQAQWGLILGLFKWVYAVCSLLGGYLADRFSRRWIISGSLFVWSAVTLWTGQVTTYTELLWARSLMGISEAFYIPAALALIADHHTGATRSRAVGLHQLAIYLGVIVGGFGGFVAADPNLGWRLAFTVCGLVGIIYAIPLSLLLQDAEVRQDKADEADLSPWMAGRVLLGNRYFILLVLYFTLPAMAGWVIRDWMPTILKDEFAIGEGPAGVAATLSWQMAAIIGVLLGSNWADRRVRQTVRGRIHVSAVGMSLIVIAIFGVGFADRLSVAIAFLALFGLGWGFFDCNNMPILAQIVPANLKATGYGIMNFVSISFGGLADLGFGILKDKKVPMYQAFGLFAAFAIVSIILVLLIRPRQETQGEPSKDE